MNLDSKKIILAAVGDIGLIGEVRKNIYRYGYDYPFRNVKHALKKADVVFGNLEMPFIDEPPFYSEKKSSQFWSDPSTARSLSEGNFSILSFANNHTLEQGPQGLETTLRTLNEIGILTVGAGKNLEESRKLVVFTKKGIKIGFLAYAKSDVNAGPQHAGPAPLNVDLIAKDISSARQKVDILIISLHFGMIYLNYPNDEGKTLCHKIIDMGADIILGHHPHVVQGIEEYNSGLIAYSLGEFVFDPKGGLWYSELGRETRKESMILIIELSSDGYQGYSFIPVYANESCQPVIAKGQIGEKITRRINKISKELLTMSSAQFYKYAGKHMVRYELNAFLYHLKRLNASYFLEKISKIRGRHVKLLLGFFRRN